MVGPQNNKSRGINELYIQRNLKPTDKRFVRATYFNLGSMFEIKCSKWSSVLQSRKLFSETYMKFIKEEVAQANTYVVIMFNHCKGWFNVDEAIDHNEGRLRGYYWVGLDRGW